MELTLRVLPPEDYPRLAGTELGTVWPVLDPQDATVLIAESPNGTIVGCWALLRCWHVEGLWVDPAHRGRAPIFRRLIGTMVGLARQVGAKTVISTATDPQILQMLQRAGTPIPGTSVAIRIPQE